MPDENDSRTIVIAQVTSEWQATLLADALRDHGVDAQVAGALTSQFRAEAPGYVRVIVPETQAAKASAALEAHRAEVSEIDWSQIDTETQEP
ncbi:MAG: hypothetical protein ACYTF9_16165 [Planctomycetota bacterium]|jgi:hypothetical protein